MFTRFKNSYETLFLCSTCQKVEPTQKINLILSPEYYWVKKLSLPVKYTREAKRLLPSIFEDSLPPANYSYMVYREGDQFIAFAYEDRKILEAIESKGIAFSNIAHIYFAQSELSTLEVPHAITEQQTLLVKDSIVLLLPSSLVPAQKSLDLDGLTLSKHRVTLTQFGHIVDTKSLYRIASMLLFIIFLLGGEYLITLHKKGQIESAKEALFEQHSLKPTMMQNEALLKKYSTIFQKQSDLRQALDLLTNMKHSKEIGIEEISFKNAKLHFVLRGVSKESETSIKKEFESKKFAVSAKFKDSLWHVEVSL